MNENKKSNRSWTLYLVRERGLEPPRPCEHYDLNVACLPIPALAQINGYSTIFGSGS